MLPSADSASLSHSPTLCHSRESGNPESSWIPAFAGMTKVTETTEGTDMTRGTYMTKEALSGNETALDLPFVSSLESKPWPWLKPRTLGLLVRGSRAHHGDASSGPSFAPIQQSKLFLLVVFQSEEAQVPFLALHPRASERKATGINQAFKAYPEMIVGTPITPGEEKRPFPSQSIAFLLSAFFLISLRTRGGIPDVPIYMYSFFDKNCEFERDSINRNNPEKKAA